MLCNVFQNYMAALIVPLTTLYWQHTLRGIPLIYLHTLQLKMNGNAYFNHPHR